VLGVAAQHRLALVVHTVHARRRAGRGELSLSIAPHRHPDVVAARAACPIGRKKGGQLIIAQEDRVLVGRSVERRERGRRAEGRGRIAGGRRGIGGPVRPVRPVESAVGCIDRWARFRRRAGIGVRAAHAARLHADVPARRQPGQAHEHQAWHRPKSGTRLHPGALTPLPPTIPPPIQRTWECRARFSLQ
jgi:hypothetical protein